MADMLTPMKWDKTGRAPRRHGSSDESAVGAGAANEKGSREAFHWPTPPFVDLMIRLRMQRSAAGGPPKAPSPGGGPSHGKIESRKMISGP